MDSGKQLLMTMTGEIHQPVRLYYQVFDHAAVLKAFTKLRCLDEDQDNQRWVWLYHGEAKKLKFHTSYAAIPRTMRPIVLGAFRFTSVQDMTLDVRSWECATQAVVFFDRYLKRSIARVTHAAIVNRLFPYTTDGLPVLEGLFAQVTTIDGEAILRSMAASLQSIQDPAQRMDKAFTLMEHQSHAQLPAVERFPVHFYEDGITSLENALRLRQIVAFEHWRGHTTCTLGEVIQKVTAGVSAIDLAP
jgi:hypothetical protein